QRYTIAVDIYSFGIIIMQKYLQEDHLIKVLTNQYIDADPYNRPIASYVCDELSRWYNIIYCGAEKDKDELAIL
ncbi:20584_t:CDS:2, partial [Gigaspora margarita]